MSVRRLASSFLAVAATLLAVSACSSEGASLPPPDTTSGDQQLPICADDTPGPETLIALFPRSYGLTVPVPTGTTSTLTVDVFATASSGSVTAMRDVSGSSPAGEYAGGSYPGTGGTCGSELASGSSCTLVLTLNGPPEGQETTWPITLQYEDGYVMTTATAALMISGEASTFTPHAHGPLTPMAKADSARVLDQANLVTVTFDDTSDVDSITTLGDWIVSSSWYAAVGEGYGVGAGTHHVAKVLEDSPAHLVGTDFARQVDDWVDEGVLPASGEDVFMFFLGSGAQSVDVPNASGWHEITREGRVYAVILPPCPGAAADPFTVTSFVAAHELIEAATDPDTVSGYRFAGADSDEVADVCNENVFVEGYSLPTVWSNPAAAAGVRPCVPSSAPFFTVDATPSVLHIGHAAGSSAMATLTGWSTERVGDWAVLPTVIGAYATYFNAFTAIDASAEMNDGSNLQLTVQVNTDVDPSAQVGIMLVSSASSPYGPGPWQGGDEVTSVLLPLVVDP